MMEIHPAAQIFPEMSADEYDALKEDMRERSQLNATVFFEGKILDGRHRERARIELHLPEKHVEWDGNGSPVEFVVSQNLHRRQLTTNQKAMLGVKIREALRAEAKARQGARTDLPDNSWEGERFGERTEHAAKIVRTSTFPIEKAAFVCEHGAPELVAAVQADQVAVHNAADIAKLPHDEQRAVVAKGPDAMLEKAKEMRQQRGDEKKSTKRADGEPIAARGLSAVAKYFDEEIERLAKLGDEKLFNQARKYRLELVGR